ncbi:hypothetical protein TNCV_1570821 [Trichonephila clavipes]|uniref:Uncharacterized protein n=1 Tax=Trichonephila clavipes TaxID=2585209 RepID=A0A8X6SNA0_TRICX|nr:hypothetical protein TNCV_1570821 [Trichonephila clavipes]
MWQRGLIGRTASARVPSHKWSAFTSRGDHLESVSSTPSPFIGFDSIFCSSTNLVAKSVSTANLVALMIRFSFPTSFRHAFISHDGTVFV